MKWYQDKQPQHQNHVPDNDGLLMDKDAPHMRITYMTIRTGPVISFSFWKKGESERLSSSITLSKEWVKTRRKWIMYCYQPHTTMHFLCFTGYAKRLQRSGQCRNSILGIKTWKTARTKNNTIATPDRPRNLLFLLIGFPLFVLLFAIHQCFK